jgi:FdhE protein
MSATATAIAGLKRERPEWSGWLAVIEETLCDTEATWKAAVPMEAVTGRARTPLLAGATIVVERESVRRLFRRLIHTASQGGTSEMETMRRVLTADPDVLEVFRGALCHDSSPTTALAVACGAAEATLDAVASLLPVPFLLASNRRFASAVSPGWVEGYCPVCGSWPAFAETRGIERNRFFRCGRCGGEWHARPLHCPFCGVNDHKALVSLVPENAGLNAVIEGCMSCFGYVKTFTRLQGCPAGAVMVDDLASVHLDVAALELRYIRPAGAGHPLDVTVIASDDTRRSRSDG